MAELKLAKKSGPVLHRLNILITQNWARRVFSAKKWGIDLRVRLQNYSSCVSVEALKKGEETAKEHQQFSRLRDTLSKRQFDSSGERA